jgi:hypothetical protein
VSAPENRFNRLLSLLRRRGAPRRELLCRQCLPCDQEFDSRIEIASPPFENGLDAGPARFDQIALRQIDLTSGRLRCTEDGVLHGRKK